MRYIGHPYGGVGRTPPFRRVISSFFFYFSFALFFFYRGFAISLQAVRVLFGAFSFFCISPKSSSDIVSRGYSRSNLSLFLCGSLLISATRTQKLLANPVCISLSLSLFRASSFPSVCTTVINRSILHRRLWRDRCVQSARSPSVSRRPYVSSCPQLITPAELSSASSLVLETSQIDQSINALIW